MENCINPASIPRRPLAEAFEETYEYPASSDELREIYKQMELYDIRPEELQDFSVLTQGLIAAGFDTSNTTL